MIISPAFASTTTAHAAEHNLFQDPTFWVGIAFCLTIIALIKLAGKAVSSLLQARADGIASKLDEASQLRRQAEQLLAEYTDRHEKMEQTTCSALKEAEEKAEKLKQEIQKDFEQKLKNRETAAEQRLNRAAEEASEEVRNKAVAIAMQAVEQILTEKLSGEEGQKLIDEAIDALPGLFNERAA